MSFKNHEYKKLPNQDDILSCLNDLDIFAHYLGGIPKRPISSPLREDKTPSFSLFHSDRHGKTMFKDFATGETGDVFVFVMRLFKMSSITDAFNRIASDMGLTQFETTPQKNYNRRSLVTSSNRGDLTRERMSIKIRRREWSIKDMKFWGLKYGLSRKQLEYCGVFPVDYYFVNGFTMKADKLAYAFVEQKDGLTTFKIYQPENEKYKWVNNNDFSTWELWSQLPEKGKRLILASSRKDAMVIKSMYPSKLLTSCALQSEKVNPKDSVVEELISRFKHIYVFYDNDFDKTENWGRLAGKKLAEEYNFKQIEIPEKYKIKDISDFREVKGLKATKLLIRNLLTQI